MNGSAAKIDFFSAIFLCALIVALPFFSGIAGAKEISPEASLPLARSTLDIPTGKGLPVVVRTGLAFVGIDSFDENNGSFVATTDWRMTWEDPRLCYPAAEGLHGYKEYRASAAKAEIARIWTPLIRFPNQIGEPTFSEQRLKIFPNGRVEVITRTTAAYKTLVDVSRFPFDHQALKIELLVKEDVVESVDLDFSHEDVGFSRVAKKAELDGWTLGLIDLRRDLESGSDGDRYAKVTASLKVQRDPVSTVATIFIPLFASLLIPFLATWMNKAEGDGFEVDAFELANVVLGGLFAVIALGFTISSAYPAIVASDNTVTRLIALNYVALAVGLIVTVVFYRYQLFSRWFGPYVQEQAFRFLTWAFPFLFISTGLAFIFVAAA